MNTMSDKKLPGQATQVGVICRHELRKFLRSKRVIGIVAVAVLASIAVVYLISNVFDPEAVAGLLGFSLVLAPALLIITAALVGSDALLVEFHEKTGYSLFANPVNRTAIWFGKFFAAEIIIFIVIGIYFGVISTASLIKFGDIPSSMWLAPMLFSLVLGTLVMSLAFLWSAVFKGPLASTITVLFSLVALPIVDMILASQQIETWFMPYSAVNSVIRVLALLDQDLLVGGNDLTTFPVIASLLVVAAYIVGFSAVSIYLFKRRDM
jgi:ABC-type transport system involved in multi-copper enzyme maturation permease subunit